MKDFGIFTCFVICLLISVLICVTVQTNNILYISQQAIAQPLTSSPTLSSHNITTTTTTNSPFLTYQDNGTLGIMIKYPFNWKRIVADDKALIFLPPSKEDKFSENLVVALFDINSSISASQL